MTRTDAGAKDPPGMELTPPTGDNQSTRRMGNMGRQMVGLSVTGSVSRHNDERDDADDRAWEKFADEVRKVAEREEFADLNLWVSGGGS